MTDRIKIGRLTMRRPVSVKTVLMFLLWILTLFTEPPLAGSCEGGSGQGDIAIIHVADDPLRKAGNWPRHNRMPVSLRGIF